MRALAPISTAFLFAFVANVRSESGRTTREHARSVEITSPVAPVRVRADASSEMVGSVQGGTRLEFGAEVEGVGCRGRFVALATGGYVCSRNLAYSSLAPGGIDLPPVRAGNLLPHRYVSTRRNETPVYAAPEHHFQSLVAKTYGRGFAFASFGRRVVDGVTFERLQNGQFVLADDVSLARPSRFEGAEIEPGDSLDHAFALEDTFALESADAPRNSGERIRRRAVLHVAAVEGDYARLVDGRLVPRAALRLASLASPPTEVVGDEAWIDISIEEQVLVLYRGARPEFVTLISSGADRSGRRTPLGTFRVRSKFAETTMDDEGNENPNDDYLVERVPWVQYFEGSIALHAAFWHDDFGRRRSHGCVNLSPSDARRLFSRTEPALPAGFATRHATSEAPGTLVRVR